MVIWTATSSSTTSILAKVKGSPGSVGIKSTAGCEFCRILVLPQLRRRQERTGSLSKSRDKNAVIRMLPGRQR
jgi:hypothetical protein